MEAEGDKKESMTFDSLRTVQRHERDSPALASLPEKFYHNVTHYFNEKIASIHQANERGGGFSEKIADQHRKELSNARDVFSEVLSRRSRKIITMAWEAATAESVIDTSPLAPEELVLFEEALECVRRFSESLSGEKKQVHEKETLKNEITMKVKIIQSLPVFVGADMKSYGPFNPGDTAELPRQNATMLVSKGRAEQI